jgi:uncharacterized protein YycO
MVDNGNYNLKPGDIVFRRFDNITSKLIRLRTLSQWSHCGIIVGRKDNSVKCLSSDFHRGVGMDNLRDWGKKVQVLRLCNATEEQINAMIDFCIRQVGVPYDYLGILDFLFMQNLQRDNRWFCSELVYSAMCHAGIDILKGRKHRWLVSPGDLYENPELSFVTEI